MKYVDFKNKIDISRFVMFWSGVLVAALVFIGFAMWIFPGTPGENSIDQLSIGIFRIFISLMSVFLFFASVFRLDGRIERMLVSDVYLEMLSTVDDLPDCSALVILKERLIEQKMRLTYGDLNEFFLAQTMAEEAKRQRIALENFITPPGAAKLLQKE